MDSYTARYALQEVRRLANAYRTSHDWIKEHHDTMMAYQHGVLHGAIFESSKTCSWESLGAFNEARFLRFDYSRNFTKV